MNTALIYRQVRVPALYGEWALQCAGVVERALDARAARLFADASGLGYEHGYVVSVQHPDTLLAVAAHRRPGLGYGSCSLSWLAVDPEYQGRGLGRGLVEAVLELEPWSDVFVSSALGAVGFYEALGFERLLRQELTWLMVRRVRC